MANASNARTNAGSSRTPNSPTPHQFQPFDWVQAEKLAPAQQSLAFFLNHARDVVQGAQTLVQLLDWDEDRRDAASQSEAEAAPAPLFDAAQRSALHRLLCASLGLLHARIEDQCEALTP